MVLAKKLLALPNPSNPFELFELTNQAVFNQCLIFQGACPLYLFVWLGFIYIGLFQRSFYILFIPHPIFCGVNFLAERCSNVWFRQSM